MVRDTRPLSAVNDVGADDATSQVVVSVAPEASVLVDTSMVAGSATTRRSNPAGRSTPLRSSDVTPGDS